MHTALTTRLRTGSDTRRQRGFTLIELMITVAVVGILAAIAYPSYQEFVAKGKRAQVTAQLVAAHQWMERFYTENFRYDQSSAGTATTDSSLFPARFSTSPPPGEGGAAYTLSLSTLARASYVVSAARVGVMANDRCGTFGITHLGQKTVIGYDSAKFADSAAAVRACWRQ